MNLESGSNTHFYNQQSTEPLVFINKSFDVLKINNCVVERIVLEGCQIGRLIIENSTIHQSIDINSSDIGQIQMQDNSAQAINIDLSYSVKDLEVENNQCQLNFRNTKDSFSEVSIESQKSVPLKPRIDSSIFIRSLL